MSRCCYLRSVELVLLEVPNGLAEQSGSNEEEEPGREDKKYGETDAGGGLVDDISDERPHEKPAYRGNWDRRSCLA